MTEPEPELTRMEHVAQRAAEAALAALPDYAGQIAELRETVDTLTAAARSRPDYAEQIAELRETVDTLTETYASPRRLLANFAEQLTALEDKYETERHARIAADAEIREHLVAEIRLALLLESDSNNA